MKWFAVFLLCFLSLAAFAQTSVTISAADIVDAHVELYNPDLNYETWGALYTGCMGGRDTKHAHFFVRPDLSSIPADATITTALCSLYEEATWASLDVEVLQVDGNWVEAEVTWNIYSTGNSWVTGGGDFSNPDDTLSFAVNGSGFVAFEVENIIQAQLNGTCYGVGFRRVGNDTCVDNWETPKFSSTEHGTAGQRPRFYIEYTLPSLSEGGWKNWGLTQWGQ